MFLPFLGEAQSISGERDGKDLVFTLPAVEKGAVAWMER
jgi:hypothetical protein